MNFTVLITVYALNPYRALDDGIAWNLIRALDQKFRLIVVTHADNRPDIELFLARETDGPGVQARFEYYSPGFLPNWKGSSPPKTLLHKYAWHWGVISFIRQRQLAFDIAHHLSLPCGWCPPFLWRLEKPFIWGPAGYPPLVPAEFIRPYGRWAKWRDWLCWRMKKTLWQWDPFIGITVRKAAHIFTNDAQAVKELRADAERTTTLAALASYASAQRTRAGQTFKITAAGPFLPIGGFDLAIRAFAAFYRQLDPADQKKVAFVLIGQGSARQRLQEMARESRLPEQAIRIIESVAPAVIETHLSESSVYFSPRHERNDPLLPQALAHGLPVICLDLHGARQLVTDCCGLKTPYGAYPATIHGFASQLHALFHNADLHRQLSEGARKKFERQLTWSARGDVFAEVYWSVFHRQALGDLLEGDAA